uniref:Uncharacterized protein n=1 Tax=Globisporangium ultimum (strain ATCC 200006 / CBS 805.95 / DAOM BR144) TaxID=431595 RepID=K3W696_GLOUD
MKTFALSSAVLLLLAAAALPTHTLASDVTVHVHKSADDSDVKNVEVPAHHGHHHKFQFKETPWEDDKNEKNAKCADFCLLAGFWQHQLGRNCVSRPTDLCMNYKLASIGLEAVIAVAECNCDAVTAASDPTAAPAAANTTAPSHR